MNFKRFFVEKEEKEDIQKTIKKLPKPHQDLVKAYRFRFQSHNTLKGDHEHIGENNEKTKTITICAPWFYSREFTFLHEIGHLVWSNFMTDVLKEKWKAMYDKAKLKDRQNAEEIFCHAYAATFTKHPPMEFYKPEWAKLIKSIGTS